MHVMLAEDIGPWIFNLLVMAGGVGAAGLAMLGLIPALKGKRLPTLLMIAPALIQSVGSTIWLGWSFVMANLASPDWELRQFVVVWLVMAGPAAGASLIVLAVLVAKRIAMGKQMKGN